VQLNEDKFETDSIEMIKQNDKKIDNRFKKGLGRGFSSLLGEPSKKVEKNKVLIKDIVRNKFQPRKAFNKENLEELTNSIKEQGIIQPIAVRPHKSEEGKYEIIAGERRWLAAQNAGLHEVPVVILDVDDSKSLEYAIVENIQRQDLSSMEEAEGYALLRGKYNLSESQIAERVGKNRSTIANKLRLIKLPPDLKIALRMKDPDFTEGHARAILSVRESKKIKNLFRRIKRDKLSVREIEKIVKNSRILKKDQNYKKISKNKYISKYEDSLIEYLGTKIIISKTKNKGSINIHFTNNEDLERVIKLILNED